MDENSEWGYGEALGRTMNAYRDGGRERRLADRLEAMTAAVESADINISTDAESESKPYSKEEKLEAIREEIATEHALATADEIEAIPWSKVVESIHTYCAKGDRSEASDRTVNNYLDRLTDDLGLTEHPKNDALFIKDDEIDGPAFEHKDYGALTTEERVEAVRVKLLQKADSGRGAQVSAADIQAEFFDGEPSDSVAHNLRNWAAEADGFGVRTARDNVKKVYVNVSEVSDKSLREAAGITDRREATAEATAEMDALMNAQVVTDGGRDME